MHFGKRDAAAAGESTSFDENANEETGTLNLDVKKRKRRLVSEMGKDFRAPPKIPSDSNQMGIVASAETGS